MNEYTLKELPKPDGNICFHAKGVVMLRLDNDGFHYKGQTIDDAGEAYRLFMTWLKSTEQDDDA